MKSTANQFGIGSGNSDQSAVDRGFASQPSVNTNPTAGSPSDRLVIKSALLSLLVKDVRENIRKIQALAENMGGFVVSSQVNRTGEVVSPVQPMQGGNNFTGSITFRVPAERLNEALDQVKSYGEKVTSERVSGADVTEEYTDLESRLKNLQATEEQLLIILKRSGEIKDVLAVEQELTKARGEIEQTKGRMKFLENSAKLSSITVYLSTQESELPIVESGWHPLDTVKAALRNLVKFWQVLADKAILWGIFLAPWIVIVGMIWLIKRRR